LGFLPHLGLSPGQNARSAYQASTCRWEKDTLTMGFAAAVAIIGSGRVHWLLSTGVEIPDWYVDFLCEHEPK
jgi:hypothetical protein